MYFVALSVVLGLLSAVEGGLIKRLQCPGTGITANDARCCVFHVAAEALMDRFDGGCQDTAHDSIRLTFHDAAGFSLSGGPSLGGGADGSIIAFSDIEFLNPDNDGLQDSVGDLQEIANDNGISFGDVIQLSGALATATCPGAPRLRFLAGRPNATIPATDGLVPNPNQELSVIKARMLDIGFTPEQTVSLLTSHTVAAQANQDTTHPQSPFDSTPFSFDSQFFVDTLISAPATGFQPNGIFRLNSDSSFARDSETACAWQELVQDTGTMTNNFAAQMARLAVIGQDESQLFDCTEVIPNPPPANRIAAFPAGITIEDIDQSCASSPFPVLRTDPGPPTTVAPVPDQD